MTRSQLSWAVAGLLFVLTSCSAPRRLVSAIPAVDPTRLLERIQQNEERIASLRATFTADSRRGTQRRSAEGVLLVDKPDRFRLRMMLPFGITVLDYVSWGEHAQLSLPLEGRIVDGPPQGEEVAFSRQDLGQAFLRGPNAFPGTCTAEDIGGDGAVVAWCRDASRQPLRQIRIDAQRGVINEETSYAGEQARMVIRYDDYRVVAGETLPYHIALFYPAQLVQLDITIHRYEVNPRLADALFAPPRPWAGS